jgi:hypothetical protein
LCGGLITWCGNWYGVEEDHDHLGRRTLQQIRNLVTAGRASSMSGFVQQAVGVAIDDVAGWGAMLAQALDESGGPMSPDERAWADAALGVPKARRRSAA